jgi:hypothetical protein
MDSPDHDISSRTSGTDDDEDSVPHDSVPSQKCPINVRGMCASELFDLFYSKEGKALKLGYCARSLFIHLSENAKNFQSIPADDVWESQLGKSLRKKSLTLQLKKLPLSESVNCIQLKTYLEIRKKW